MGASALGIGGITIPAERARYVAGVIITVVAVLSQYFLPQAIPSLRPLYRSLVGDLLVVYGVPILAFSLLVGPAPLRRWKNHLGSATWTGLSWYGSLSVAGIALSIALVLVYEAVDPSALALLQRPNPALEQAARDPWFYVGLSFLVGAVEETIFRGWMFGYWNGRSGSWFVPATWTSAVFAGVHLYYGLTYGPASPLVYPSLFLIGFAFAATYRFSGGNLVVPALLHGAHDAAAYFGLIDQPASLAIEYGLIGVGALIALIDYLRGRGRPGSETRGEVYRLTSDQSDGETMSSIHNPSGPSK